MSNFNAIILQIITTNAALIKDLIYKKYPHKKELNRYIDAISKIERVKPSPYLFPIYIIPAAIIAPPKNGSALRNLNI